MFNNKGNPFREKKDYSIDLTTLVLFGIAILMWYGLFHINDFNPKDINIAKPKAPQTKQRTAPNLSVTKSVVCPVDMLGTLGVCGIVQNNTNRYITYAQIDINLYDRANNLIATAMDNINNIPPNGTWQFRAFPLSVNIPLFSRYEIINLRGY